MREETSHIEVCGKREAWCRGSGGDGWTELNG